MTTSVDVLPLPGGGRVPARQGKTATRSSSSARRTTPASVAPTADPSFGFNVAKGMGLCFSCGWRTSFSELVKYLTGHAPDPDVMEQIIESSIINKLTERKRDLLVDDFSVQEWTLG